MSEATNSVYYVQVRGKALGPLRFDQVKQLIDRGQLTRSHPVSKDGNGWCAAGNLAELFPPDPTPEPDPEPAAESASSGDKPPQTADETKWYYEIDAQEFGPVPESQIRSLIASGALTAKNHVWCAGMESWTPLHATALAKYLPAADTNRKESKTNSKKRRNVVTGPDLPTRSEAHLGELFELPPETKVLLSQCSTWSLITGIGLALISGVGLLICIAGIVASENPPERFGAIMATIGHVAMLIAVLSLFRAVGVIASVQTFATWRQFNDLFRHWRVFWTISGIICVFWMLLLLLLLIIVLAAGAGN
ncbi:hypothetical protein JCM19992_35020 [Thermostilla marina]